MELLADGLPVTPKRNNVPQALPNVGRARWGCSRGDQGCGVVWCDVVWCGVVWCGVVWCGVPKALLPEGNGRDVYPRVQVNGRGCVCGVRAVCKCVVA